MSDNKVITNIQSKELKERLYLLQQLAEQTDLDSTHFNLSNKELKQKVYGEEVLMK